MDNRFLGHDVDGILKEIKANEILLIISDTHAIPIKPLERKPTYDINPDTGNYRLIF